MFEGAKTRLERLQSQLVSRPLSSDLEFEAVGALVVEAKAFRKEWDEATKPVRKATKDAHSAACKMFSDIADPLERIERAAIPLLDEYQRREEIERAKREAELTKQAKKAGSPVESFSATTPKLTAPEGLSRRVMWRAEVTDKMALVKAVAAGKIPLAYLEPNIKVLDMQATALKNEMKIPGVVAVEETGYAARAAR